MGCQHTDRLVPLLYFYCSLLCMYWVNSTRRLKWTSIDNHCVSTCKFSAILCNFIKFSACKSVFYIFIPTHYCRLQQLWFERHDSTKQRLFHILSNFLAFSFFLYHLKLELYHWTRCFVESALGLRAKTKSE